MKYLLLIYGDEKVRADSPREQQGRVRESTTSTRSGSEDQGLFLGGRRAGQPTDQATTVQVRDGQDRDHRRPVRGDEGAAGRLLRHRGGQPRPSDRGRRHDAPEPQYGTIEVRPIVDM